MFGSASTIMDHTTTTPFSTSTSTSELEIALLSIMAFLFLLIIVLAFAVKFLHKLTSPKPFQNNLTLNYTKESNDLTITSEIVLSHNQTITNTIQINLDFSNFKKEQLIGKGSYGLVYMCSLPPKFEHKYAVKHMFSLNLDEVVYLVYF